MIINKTVKFVPDWCATSKTIKKVVTALCAYENILYFEEDLGNVAFNCNEMSILNIDLRNINLDNSFDEDDPGTIIHFRLLTWHIKSENSKTLKKRVK